MRMSGRVVAVALSPAWDRWALAAGSASDRPLRVSQVVDCPGGKATHAAVAARLGGAAVDLILPIGGRTGQQLHEGCAALGLQVSALPIRAATRRTYTVVSPGSADSLEIIEPAAPMSRKEVRSLVDLSLASIREGDIFLIAGSMPDGLEADDVYDMVRGASQRGAATLVDLAGSAAEAALRAGSYVFTPNGVEAAEITGIPLHQDVLTLTQLARSAQQLGSENVVVTAGSTGAVVALADGSVWLAHPPSVVPVSAVGCGDALVGGLAAALAARGTMLAAVREGMRFAAAKLAVASPLLEAAPGDDIPPVAVERVA